MKQLFWIGGLFIVLAGCGGSSSDSAPGNGQGQESEGNVTSLAGKVADGYLHGANVCLDTNKNYACDGDEAKDITDIEGSYRLDNVPVQDADSFPVIAEVLPSTIDQDTGQQVGLEYVMSAPAQKHHFISPLTTMVQIKLERNSELSVDEAEEQIRVALGNNGPLSIFDDYIAAQSDSSQATVEQYHRTHKVAQVAARAYSSNLASVKRSATEAGLDTAGFQSEIVRFAVKEVYQSLGPIIDKVDASGEIFDPDAIEKDLVRTFGASNIVDMLDRETTPSKITQLVTDREGFGIEGEVRSNQINKFYLSGGSNRSYWIRVEPKTNSDNPDVVAFKSEADMEDYLAALEAGKSLDSVDILARSSRPPGDTEQLIIHTLDANSVYVVVHGQAGATTNYFISAIGEVYGSGISKYVTSPIVIDGNVSQEEWGNKPSVINQSIFYDQPDVLVFYRNDQANLYALVDVLVETVDDFDPKMVWTGDRWNNIGSNTHGLGVVFDNDADGIVPEVTDWYYTTRWTAYDPPRAEWPDPEDRPEGYEVALTSFIMNKSYGADESDGGGWGGTIKNEATFERGFGKTFNSQTPHLYFEIEIPLTEFCRNSQGESVIYLYVEKQGPAGEGGFKRITLEDVSYSIVGKGSCGAAIDFVEIYEDKSFVCNSVYIGDEYYVRLRNTALDGSIKTTVATDGTKNVGGSAPDGNIRETLRTFTVEAGESVGLGCRVTGIQGLSDHVKWFYEAQDASWAN